VPLLIPFFNAFLATGYIPPNWRSAYITPTYKKGPCQNPNNYRPISVTAQLGKIFESVIYQHIYEFLMAEEALSDNQHGFRSGYSTVTNLLTFYASIYEALDCNTPVDAIYMDCAKAFDQVPHHLLLHKLCSFGITGNILHWIGLWLSERAQAVVINGFRSKEVGVTSGTVQGSVLGPLLFLLYFEDFGEGLKNFLNKYADDSKVSTALTTDESHLALQTDLDNLHEWSQLWELNIHPDKTFAVHFGRDNPKGTYFWGDTPLTPAESVRDLGVTVDDKLSFSKHIASTIQKANGISAMISRTISSRRKEVYLKLFLALVRPILEYAIDLWRPFHKKDLKALEQVQRRVTKRVTGLWHTPYEYRLQRLQIPSLWWRYMRGGIITLYKIMQDGYGGSSLCSLFKICTNATRGHPRKLEISYHRHEWARHTFFARVIPIWNGLPEQTVMAPNVNSFKNRLDQYVQQETDLRHYFVE
jgi:ribonuclease P/MRP protein subunit RPP40